MHGIVNKAIHNPLFFVFIFYSISARFFAHYKFADAILAQT